MKLSIFSIGNKILNKRERKGGDREISIRTTQTHPNPPTSNSQTTKMHLSAYQVKVHPCDGFIKCLKVFIIPVSLMPTYLKRANKGI